jgi:hypothetical protein
MAGASHNQAARSSVRASVSQVVNIGSDLRRQLDEAARAEGRDATSLARKLLRDYLAGGGRHEPQEMEAA